MRLALFLFLVLLFSSCQSMAQKEKSVLLEQVILSMEEYPEHLFEADGKTFSRHAAYLNDLALVKIKYKSDGLLVTGWIARPKADGQYPVIIANRGGNQEFGAWTPRSAAFFLARMAKEGYYVIASNYRGNAGGEGREEFGGADIND